MSSKPRHYFTEHDILLALKMVAAIEPDSLWAVETEDPVEAIDITDQARALVYRCKAIKPNDIVAVKTSWWVRILYGLREVRDD